MTIQFEEFPAMALLFTASALVSGALVIVSMIVLFTKEKRHG